MPIDDITLIKRAVEGDSESFQKLVPRYYGAVFSICYKFTGNADDAEDILQEVFIKALRKIHTLRKPKKFKSWLFGISRNMCIDWYRRATKLSSLNEGHSSGNTDWIPNSSSHTPSEICEKRETAQIIRDAIQKLPEVDAEIMYLRFMEGFSYKEISEFLDISLDSINARIYRSKNKLRKILIKYEDLFD